MYRNALLYLPYIVFAHGGDDQTYYTYYRNKTSLKDRDNGANSVPGVSDLDSDRDWNVYVP